MTRIYQRQTYEDLAGIIKRLKSTVAYSSVPCSASDILTDLENEVVQLFENKGQSFNKTRFLNASKVNEQELIRPENLITIPEPTEEEM